MTNATTNSGTPAYSTGKFEQALASGSLIASGMSGTSGNYTLEAWVYIPASGTHGTIAAMGWASASYSGWMGVNAGNYITFNFGGTGQQVSAGWHHWGIQVDSGGYLVWFLDGTYMADSGSGVSAITNVSIGKDTGSTAEWGTFAGALVDEVRLSSGFRYSQYGTYTVPTAAFTADASTIGLWHLDGNGTDAASAVNLPFTDAFTGTDGAALSTNYTASGSGTAKIKSNRGELVTTSGAYNRESIGLTGATAGTSWDVTLDVLPAAQVEGYILLSATSTGGYGYEASNQYGFEVGVTGSYASLQYTNAGSRGAVGSGTFPSSVTTTAAITMRTAYDATAGTLKGKLWNTGSAEPDWQYTATGVAAISGIPSLSVSNGNSTGVGTFDLDNLVVKTASASVTTASGTAALSGTGSLSQAGIPKEVSATAFSGTGSLAASSTIASAGNAVLTGSGTLTAATTPKSTGSAALAGSGTLTATPSSTATGSATFAGSGTLTTTSVSTVTGTAALTGSGALTYASGSASAGIAALAGSGTLSATAKPTASASLTLTGIGTLSSSAAPRTADVFSITGTGALVSGSGSQPTGAAGLSGTGALNATGTTAVKKRLRIGGLTVKAAYYNGVPVRAIGYGNKYTI